MAPLNVTAVTGTLTQFIDVEVGRNTASPSTRSPGFRLGFVLELTFPWMRVSPVTDVVLIVAVVFVPVLHAMVAVKPDNLPVTQLAVAVTGLGEIVTVPLMSLGTLGLARLP